MRLRVEDLAGRTGISVDTVRFYQKEKLLPPPEREGRVAFYGAEHVERIGRIRELQRRGFTLAVIRRFLTGELDDADEALVAALTEDPDGGGDGNEEFFDLDTLGQRAGVPIALLESLLREGVLVPRMHDGEERYTPADADAMASGLALLEVGLGLPDLLDLARRHHRATREIAEAAVALFDTQVREPLRESGLAPEERAEHLVETFRVALPAITTLVAHHFGRVLLQVAQEHLESVGEAEEVEAARSEARRRLDVVRLA